MHGQEAAHAHAIACVCYSYSMLAMMMRMHMCTEICAAGSTRVRACAAARAPGPGPIAICATSTSPCLQIYMTCMLGSKASIVFFFRHWASYRARAWPAVSRMHTRGQRKFKPADTHACACRSTRTRIQLPRAWPVDLECRTAGNGCAAPPI